VSRAEHQAYPSLNFCRCTTTPVTRGRPPKKHLPVTPGPRSASESEPPPSDSQSNASSQYEPMTLSSNDSARRLDLSPELVHHLFECAQYATIWINLSDFDLGFTHLPQSSHPMFRGPVIRNELASCSWQIHLLPLQERVVAHCVVYVASLQETSKMLIITKRTICIDFVEQRYSGTRASAGVLDGP
jgi:hypothetical protein